MARRAKIGFLAMAIAWWALVLFGWGFDDLGGFFSHPARLGLAVVGLLGGLYFATATPELHPLRKGHQLCAQDCAKGLVGSMVFVVWAWFLPFGDRRGVLVFGESDLWRWVGVILVAGGDTLRLISLRALGNNYGILLALRENHQLIQTNIYKLIRHPFYLGVMLTFGGWALTFRSWLVIPGSVLLGIFLVRRIQQEEKILGERFGADFAAYCRRTWRLLPYVY